MFLKFFVDFTCYNKQADGSSNAEQQGGHPHAQLDSLLAEGKLLDAALLAAKQQQQLQAGSACGKTLAARAQVVVAVEADSATTHAASDAAADGHTLQEQQQEEKQQDMWQVGAAHVLCAHRSTCMFTGSRMHVHHIPAPTVDAVGKRITYFAR